MQQLEVSGAVRHIYIYVIRRLKVNKVPDCYQTEIYTIFGLTLPPTSLQKNR